MTEPVALFEPNIAGWLAHGLSALERELRANGQRMPAEVVALRDTLRASSQAVGATSHARSGQGATTLGDSAVVPDAPPMPPVMLTYKDVAASLSISTRTVQRLVAEGSLRAIDVGGRGKRVHRDELDAYIASRGDDIEGAG